jgi:DNA-binding GntR family transcriptional regulator
VEPISDLPMVDDIDADYSPQYVKLARILRDKITSGEHPHGARLPAVVLAREHGVSAHVALQALAMLAANRYVDRKPPTSPYRVTWEPAPAQERGQR